MYPMEDMVEETKGFFGAIKKTTNADFFSKFFWSGKPGKSATQSRKQQQILEAFQKKDIELLCELIDTTNVDHEVSEEMRLSDLSALIGNKPFLQVVVEKGAQLNSPNASGQVPLHYALSSPDSVAVVEFLLQNGASTELPLPNGDFPVHKACSDASTAMLQLLLNHEASPESRDRMGMTALHRACINDQKDHVEIVYDRAPELISEQDNDGKTPLHIAVANQNILLMKFLLDRGATIDKETTEGLTPIDLMMSSKNRGALRELIFYFTDKVSKDVKACKVQELYKSKQFRKFLSLLQLIDVEAQKCYYRSKEDSQSPEEERLLVKELLDLDEENTQDVIDFQSKMMAALKTSAIHDCNDDREIIDTIAIYTTKYILFREDLSMLQDVMKCGVLWARVSGFLEQHINTLYSKTNRDGSLISKLFTDQYLETSGKKTVFRRVALMKKVGEVLAVYNLEKVNVEFCLDVPNPIDTLVIWSILTGKLNLTLEFLSRVKFELVPTCLMAAGLLRNLHKVFGVHVIELASINFLADQCELFACKAVGRTEKVDISEDKRITYQFLLQRMPAFGGLTCINLAANCSCDTFMQMEICQKAMDVAWYRFLLDLNPVYREIIILLGAIPFNPIVLAALYRDYQRPKMERSREAADKTDQGNSLSGSKRSFKIDEEEETAAMFSENLDFSDGASVEATARHRIAECWWLYYYFYQIPAVKFRYFTVSHLVLLATLSYMVQFELNASVTPLEIFVYVTAFGFLAEETKKLVIAIWSQQVSNYAKNKWNSLDALTSIVFLSGFILRIVVLNYRPSTDDMQKLFDDPVWFSARFCLGLACLLYWLKLLNISRVHEYFGPKLKMIYNMIIHDLIPFLFILAVFLFGFGILICSTLYPNGHFAYNANRISFVSFAQRMMQICFFSIFGEYPLDTMTGEDSDCSEVYKTRENNSLACPNPQAVVMVPYILLPIYVTITTILLLSLIVALFSKTIEEIDSNSTALWQFERFAFINEYELHSSLPPPINVLDMSRLAMLAVFHRYLPATRTPVEMDFFSQEVTLRHLINQAIALRNGRQKMLVACQAKEAKASEVLLKRSSSFFKR